MQGLDISLFIFFYVAYPFAKNKYLQAFCFGINNTPRYAKCHEQRVEGEHSQFADTLAQDQMLEDDSICTPINLSY